MPIKYGNRVNPTPYTFRPDSGWLESAWAGVQRESNLLGGIEAMSDQMPELTEADQLAYPNFDVRNHIPDRFKDTEYERHFEGLGSVRQTDWKADRLDEELSMAGKIHGLSGFAGSMVGSLASISTPLDLLAVVKFGKMGTSVAQQAFKAGATTGALTALDEIVLNSYQDTRTGFETGAAIGGSIFLGTGATALLAKKPYLREVLETGEAGERPNLPTATRYNSSTGAAERLMGISQDELNVINKKYEKRPEWERDLAVFNKQGKRYEVVARSALNIGGAQLFKWMSPNVYMAMSKSKVMNMFGSAFSNSTLATRAHLEYNGKTQITYQAAIDDMGIDRAMDDLFSRAHKDYSDAHGKTKRTETDRLMQKAIAADGVSDDAAISASAKEFIKMNDEWGRSLVKSGILEGGDDGLPLAPLGDKKWFQRTWSTNYALSANKGAYANELADLEIKTLERLARDEQVALKGGRAEAAKKFKKAQGLYILTGDKVEIQSLKDNIKQLQGQLKTVKSAELKKDINKSLKQQKARLEKEMDTGVRQARTETKAWKKKYKDAKKTDAAETKYTDALKEAGTPAGKAALVDFYNGMYDDIRRGVNWESSGQTPNIDSDGNMSFIQGRTANIATDLIPDRFLEGDSVLSVTRSIKRLNRQMLLRDSDEFSDDTLQNWRDYRDLEHRTMVEQTKANDKLTDAQKKRKIDKLNSELGRDIGYINKMLKEYYQLDTPIQTKSVRNIADTLKMLSALNKLGSVLVSTLGETAAGLNQYGVRGYLRYVTSWMADPKGMAALATDTRHDLLLGVRVSQASRIAEVTEFNSGMGAKMRMAHKATDGMIEYGYGLGVWTRFITTQMGVIGQSQLGRSALKGWDNLSKTDKINFARAGISESKFRQVEEQVKKHHKKVGLSYDIKLKDWDNQKLADDVTASIFTQVENTIIKPREGDSPFWSKSLEGSVLLQFKSFMMASTSKYWLSDVQRMGMKDYRGLERQLAFMGMGAVVWEIKNNYLYNEPKELSTAEYIGAAISFGGGAAAAMELWNLGDELWGEHENSMYRGARTATGVALGPSASTLTDTLKGVQALGKLARGDEVPGDLWRGIERASPGGNSIPWRLYKKHLRDD